MRFIINQKQLLCLALTFLGGGAAPGEEGPGLSLAGHSELLEQKQAVLKRDAEALANLKEVTRAADEALKGGVLSVTDKTRVTPGGSKHDYFTQAPYWWPDPDKADGLPFIRKDGRVYPESRGEHVDYERKGSLFKRLRALGRASVLTGDPEYSDAAVGLLETWFINPATRMNPNLDHGQAIPGRDTGRPAGIIEWCNVGDVTSTILLLRADGTLPDATDKALVEWFGKYADWLQTSKIGREERDAKNNHGTWYDVQLVTLLIFLDRPSEARAILEEVKTRRIATQIEPDGRQPHELARTKSLSYSKMNLTAFKRLARLGELLDVDLTNYETPDGRGIRMAGKFIESRTGPGKTWPYPQL